MEIDKMVECNRLIIPVFYDVEPHEVRNQKGPFGSIFQTHEESGENGVKEWRDALTQAGEIKGYDIKTEAYGREKKFIPLILKRVLKEVNRMPLDVPKFLVGLDSRISKVMKMLNVEASGARMVGIHGMGGIGKTTLAKAIYNRLQPNFEACSFISDIRKASKKYKGLVSLQEQLINDLAIDKDPSISSVSQGINIIKRRVHSKAVLIVLDYVDHISQLDAFAGSRDWFFTRSRIIITTRNVHVLNVHKVNQHQTCKLNELNADESLELFSYHAFQNPKPLDRYTKLSKRVVSTTGGLPLALEIIGALLFDKNSLEEWEKVLEKLQKVPIDEIQGRLELSLDGLDGEEKCIFLDIAGLLDGMEKEDAIHIWKGCDLFPNIAIRVLLHKSLITINDGNSGLHMHDQLRDMGRQIVLRESLKPGERSRLWHHDQILTVLANREGTAKVEGIIVNFEEAKDGVQSPLRTESLAELSKLRLLRANYANIIGDFQHFPRELRWLEWQGFPLGSLPLGLHLDETAVLNLSKSNIKEMQCKVFDKLKVLNLSGCYHLTITPDFSVVPCLVKLILDNCISLVEVHKSIGHLKAGLVLLSMKGCKELMELPNELCQLTSLGKLILSHCSKLCSLPNQLGDPMSLTNLAVGGTLLTKLPNSLGKLSIFENLLLDDCYQLKELPSSIGHLSKLKILDIGYCTSLATLPSSVGDATNLKKLVLDATALEELPDTIGLLRKLEILSLGGCKMLKILPSSMGKMRKLHHLDITESQIRELPEDFGCMSKLSVLHIGQNATLGSLPTSFSQLRSLAVLHVDLHNVSVEKIPENFGNLSSLQSLTLFNSKHASLSLVLAISTHEWLCDCLCWSEEQTC
ncbi:disease resistance protein RPV1-like isoform X2 [Nymphaea colorata]|uniref:disease resistance protein RPV1-like isoform X2 n=1 Tax=Nymphaea colorata TaxID=210225 RepID=UPI00214E88B7|nr:disease resistance protein RPV1-like isoform X2 [Nymphaea colorata]